MIRKAALTFGLLAVAALGFQLFLHCNYIHLEGGYIMRGVPGVQSLVPHVYSRAGSEAPWVTNRKCQRVGAKVT